MVVEAAAEGGKQHGFAIDGQGIADVKPGQLLLVGFSSTTEYTPDICLLFSDQITAIRS